MSIKQTLGSLIILTIIFTTILTVLGIWGIIEEAQAWKLFWTLLTTCVGLGTASGCIDYYFKDKHKDS